MNRIRVYSIPIAELEEFGCNLRAINILERQGISWLGELLQCTPKELSRIKNIGDRTASQIIMAVKTHREVFKW